MNLFTRLFRQRKKTPLDKMKMNISPDQAAKMLHMIQNTQNVELTCDDVHGLLDQYTEMAIRGEDVVGLLPLVLYHLDMCPDCREEYEALSRILHAV
ncbi:MAG: hypothetical protein FD147_593 [Chloroflexi bacterium]|nr:MAG: hypothetical protein FD147_593 [Chloroflexota bacterium]